MVFKAMNLQGIKTWLPSELRKQEEISSTLVEIFKAASYEEISIPSLVDYEVISRTNAKFSNEIFKLLDKDGKLLALRTEMTQPIARLVAERAEELEFPLRLYYDSSIFRYKGQATDDSREIRQVGVEHFGSATSDKEIMQLVLDSATKLGLKNYKITITDAAIWRAVIEKYEDFGLRLYKLVLAGDLIAFKQLVLADHPLTSLLGSDIKAVEEALGLDLSGLAEVLALAETVVFDPLQCPDINLYTGLHFNLHVRGEGKVIARGGRYDKLLGEFAKDMPAIGFAFYLPRLISVLEQESSSTKTLKIAVSKGTLLEGALEFFKAKGLEASFENKRKLIVQAGAGLGFEQVEFLKVRGHDVPTYVEHGAADLGVVGLDTAVDSGAKLVKLNDLDYGHCKLCVCAKQGKYKTARDLPNYARIATSFPNITTNYFRQIGREVEVINLYGSVELGPLTELSDAIVDLVATGTTLKENGLEVIDEILPCTAILVANNSAMKIYKNELLALS
ncbi:MAG: ATP phosphoribosyltransferase [Candidatus Melainabacteria bacterium]|nr:ATP phosphoribosyltransferase [Candidatus Melainabacteria bacterium]